MKNFFKKSVDKPGKMCIIVYVRNRNRDEKEDTKMMNEWYMNPEIHEEDYEELMALLMEEAEAEEAE